MSVFIPPVTVIPGCESSVAIVIGGYIEDPTVSVGDNISSDLTYSGTPTMAVTYIQEEDGFAYFETSGFLSAAGSYEPTWEYKGVELAPLFEVYKERPDTVTVFDPPGQDSILVTRVCGTEISRDTISGGGSGSGTVTSVGLSLPSQFSVTGSPVTSSGTLSGAWQNQAANTVLAGPSSGGAAAPTFRSLVAADITAADGVTGSGTTNKIALWSSATELTDSYIKQDGSNLVMEANIVDVIANAIPGKMETLQRWYVSDAPSSYVSIFNNTGTDGAGRLAFFGQSTDNLAGPLTLIGQTGLDVGNAAVTTFQSQFNTSPVSVRPTFSFRNRTTTQMLITASGNVGINTTLPSYILDLNGTGGMRIPVGTTPQRPTGANGVIRYNTTESLYEGYRNYAYTFFPWMNAGLTQLTAKNYVFNIDQTVGAGQDNYILTYDNGTGEIQLEANAAPDQNATYYQETERQYTLTTTGADTIITVDTLTLAIGTDSISMSSGLIENLKADTVRWQVSYDFFYSSDEDPCYSLMDITSDGTEEPVAIPGSAARAEQVSLSGGQMPGRTFLVDVPPGEKIRLCVKGNVGVATQMNISYLTITINEINR